MSTAFVFVELHRDVTDTIFCLRNHNVFERINSNFSKMVENAVYLYDTEQEFRDKVKDTPYFCLPHYKGYVLSAREHMNKKKVPDFQKALADTVNRYFDELRADVSHFCKKFDYRYENEPWGNSKDSVERAVKFLSCDRRLKFEKPKKGDKL